MTKTTKPIRRETYTSVREARASRPLIIELCSTYLLIRPKGRRYYFTVTYDQVWNVGARNAAKQLREAKAEARKARIGK